MKVADHEDLFKRYQSGEVTPEEQAIVEDYILNHEFTPLYLSEAELKAAKAKLSQRISRISFIEHQTEMVALEEQPVVPLYRRWKGIVALAAAIAAITLGTWLYYASPSRFLSFRNEDKNLYANDITPGKNGAAITLANGKVIQLSDQKAGVIVGNELKYEDGTTVTTSLQEENTKQSSAGILTAVTARGQTYQITLSDGTRVWLNADSKLEFPSKFSKDKQRMVKLSGEAYFVVVHNAKQPFRVESKGQVVEDIGTEFNINAYANEENVKTTLVEGSARVSSLSTGTTKETTILKPGQQSVLTGNKQIKVKQIDPAMAISWKKGEFVFKNEDFETAMRTIARWYDVEIIYRNEKPINLDPRGWVSRNSNISSVLKMIESTGDVHFKIERRRIIVTN